MNAYETLIATAALSGLIKAGYYISVDFDRGYEASSARNINNPDKIPTALAAMDEVDECWLMLSDAPHDDNSAYDAFVYFIWGNGNEGRDCLSNWTSTDRINAVVDPLDETWCNAQMAAALSALPALATIRAMIGNVDHSKGHGPNAAAMRGDMLNDIRALCDKYLK